MSRWGRCWGGAVGTLALVAAGAAAWLGWVAFALFGWGAVMAVYTFDRPAPPGSAPRA